MKSKTTIPNLFRKESQKMISVLSHLFGMPHIEIAEDIVGDTFLAATESWAINGVPEHPEAWLYATAKNKAKNYFKHTTIFNQKIAPEINYSLSNFNDEIEIDLTVKNIEDSQLAMIFTVCHPCNSDEAQIALALNLLCGFGPNEIADAYLTNREIIYKRINRAKEKLKEENIAIETPKTLDIKERMENVLKIIYLLFSEGYYSTSQNTILRKDFCTEAMRLAFILIGNKATNLPETNALMALMCFHASRFEARLDTNGEMVLYEDQDESLWNRELIERGAYFLGNAASGEKLSKYHLEAGIAYWHTNKNDSQEKWNKILDHYNILLLIESSPIVALNRCYAFSKVKGKSAAIAETEKLRLEENHFYYSLLGNLYTGIDQRKALANYNRSLKFAKTSNDRLVINKAIEKLEI